MNTLPPGLYVLSTDVRNPKGQVRIKHQFWKLWCWPKGQKFVVELLEPGASADHLILRPAGDYQMLTFTEHHRDILNELLPHLVSMNESFESILLAAHEDFHRVTERQILRQLIRDGVIDLGILKRAIARARGQGERT